MQGFAQIRRGRRRVYARIISRIYLHKDADAAASAGNNPCPRKLAKRPTKILINALSEEHSHDPATLFDIDGFLAEFGFPQRCAGPLVQPTISGHAITALFFTDWADALIYTADGRGDNGGSFGPLAREGNISCLFGGEETLLDPLRLDSLGFAYALSHGRSAPDAAGTKEKVTGLAAYGEPTLYERMA